MDSGLNSSLGKIGDSTTENSEDWTPEVEVKLPPLPTFKGNFVDLSEMPESALDGPNNEKPLRIVGIRFSEEGRVYDFDAEDISLFRGEAVIVEHDKVIKLGWVSKPPLMIDNSQLQIKLRRVLRKADDDDIERFNKKTEREKNAHSIVTSAIRQLNLSMTLLDIEFTLDLKKVTVFFASENRVDFRQLLKNLVRELKAKVELRQIGARDQAKSVGGIGPCGEELCCSRHLNKFHPVTIKMAKEQDLSLKPTRVAGMCGRLKCCLAYERDMYILGRKSLPRVGKCVKCKSSTEGGCSTGLVRELDVPRQLVTIEFDDGTMKRVPASEILEQVNRKPSQDRGRLAATSDEDQIVQQIREASSGSVNDVKDSDYDEGEEDYVPSDDESTDD